MRNEPQLITYVDRLAGDLGGLDRVLHDELAGAFGGVHLLPFFFPIDGADAGFDPVDHTRVDERLGTWDDVGRIGASFDVMADLIVNHVSAQSPEFTDWIANGADSAFDGMFLTAEAVFGADGPSETDLAAIYRPRPGSPFTTYDVAGTERQVWTTFTANQIDIDVDHPAAWAYLLRVLDRFAAAGVDLVRLDAVGYAIKKAGTSCFMLSETFDFIGRLGDECHRRDMSMLVEIHSHFETQVEIAKRVDLVYDFALPPLMLHTLHRADAGALRTWLDERPANCITVLDTHDGIGVIDVASATVDGERRPGLLPDDDVDRLVEAMHDASEGRSRAATGAAASNLDLYQVNCTFYEALGSDDDAYFAARLLQVLVPGVPQIYYAGALAAPNDMALLEATSVGRDINRPYYDDAALAGALERPIVQRILAMLRWRKDHSALFDGDFSCPAGPDDLLTLTWSGEAGHLEATFDLTARTVAVTVDGAPVRL